MKMRFVSLLLFTVMLPLALWAQKVEGNGRLRTTSRAVDDFQALEINGAFEVELTQGQGYGVQVITDENLQDLVRVKVVAGRLIIGVDSRLRDARELKLLIDSDVFEKIELNGAISLSSTTPLYGESLRLDLNGASSAHLAVAYQQLQTEIRGAGGLELKGEVEVVEHRVSGAGSISAFNLEAEEVKVDISGAGSAQVYARQDLVAEISGMGSITYQGSPRIAKNISGLGSLARR